MNHYKKGLLLMFLVMALTLQAISQTITLPPGGANQKANVTQWMGLVKAQFNYNSPDVTSPTGEDRTGKIWGELVPWGMVNLGFGSAETSPWRAGANENTVFYVSHDVQIEGKDLPAGHYGFHIIPQKSGSWTLIFSKNYTSWGSYFYDPDEDALRVDVSPVESEFNEWLTYGFENRQLGSCIAFLKWENLKVPFNIKVPDIHDLYLSRIREELRSAPGFTYLSWIQAVNYCVQNNINLEEALTWADNAISTPFIGRKNYQTLQSKASVLKALGNQADADKIMDEAIKDPTASLFDIHQYGRSLISDGRNEKALEVFEYNRKVHPDDTFTTYVGLARGNAAIGSNKKAIRYWETAIENLPEDQKPNLSYYEAELKKLQE
jgi:tetratricopeptide (TPR) repeat protein